jgi:hypothetical protein
MLDRTKLTQEWLDQLDSEFRPDLSKAMLEWWRNIRHTGGLGLSDVGYSWLTQELELPHWRYVIPHTSATSMSLQRQLTLDQHCPCVYWFRSTSRDFQIAFFDSQQAMMFNLYGDLDRYLAMIKRG